MSYFIGKSIFNIFISFPGLPSQSSFVQRHFSLSVHSKVCKVHLKITTAETNLESTHVHNIFEANFVIF